MRLHYKEDLPKKIDVFLEKVNITLSKPVWCTGSASWPQKNGKLRLVIDYCQLKKQTKRVTCPILSIEEIFDTLEGNAYFTSINITTGSYQSPVGGIFAGIHSFR